MLQQTNLQQLLKTMQPILNEGEYVFCFIKTIENIDLQQVLFLFKEAEGITLIITKTYADKQEIAYEYVASWITLNVYSSLEATGLTAAFSMALANNNISCNVVAAFNHDHIFVAVKDSSKAIETLRQLSVAANL